ncbi:serine protease [Kitasatospora sp. NPDC127067]|uniref:serine protease n=1 Tax=Kitasatospora sp. NPDC127067 TaxID=3347126 RepID=UPI0036538E12
MRSPADVHGVTGTRKGRAGLRRLVAGTAAMLTASAALLGVQAVPASAISGGHLVTSSTAYPYQVAVLGPVQLCGGSLVTPRWVLTSASCVTGLLPADVEVRAGSDMYYAGGVTAAVTQVVIHPNYNPATFDANLALLELASPLTTSSSIKPVPLANALPAAGTVAEITGWGAENPALELPPTLKAAELTMFSQSNCQKYKNGRLTSGMFCAGDPTGVTDTCPEDGGDPLVHNGALIGVYSWGGACGLAAPNPSSPVFTNVVTYASWINTATN